MDKRCGVCTMDCTMFYLVSNLVNWCWAAVTAWLWFQPWAVASSRPSFPLPPTAPCQIKVCIIITYLRSREGSSSVGWDWPCNCCGMHLSTASFHLLSLIFCFKIRKGKKGKHGGVVFGSGVERTGALSMFLQQIVGLSVKLWEGRVSDGNGVKPDLYPLTGE